MAFAIQLTETGPFLAVDLTISVLHYLKTNAATHSMRGLFGSITTFTVFSMIRMFICNRHAVPVDAEVLPLLFHVSSCYVCPPMIF